MGKDNEQDTATAPEGEGTTEAKPKVKKENATYTIFVTEDDGVTLKAVGVVSAQTSDRARRLGAQDLLKEEGQYVNVIAVAHKALTIGRFGIERPEPKLVAA